MTGKKAKHHALHRKHVMTGGKVTGKALLNLNVAQRKTGVDKPSQTYVPPVDPMQEQLVETWAMVLGLDRTSIGIETPFTSLGGDSLKATILAAELHKRFDVKLDMGDVFRFPTIRQQAHHIGQAEKQAFVNIEAAEKKDVYPLSPSQKRLYILQQLEPESIAYNIPVVALLEGRLDRLKLENAFRQVVARHESLRTSFELHDDEPVQRIHEDVDFRIGPIGPIGPIKDIISGFIKPFNLSRAPLMRVGIAKTGEPEHLLMVDMHHTVSDGTSLAILVNEVMAYYAGKTLPPLKLQYKDYAQWQSLEARQESLEKQGAYWQGIFDGEIPVLSIPYDFPRPAVQQFEGKRLVFTMGPEHAGAIKILAQDNDTTLYTVLLSLYTVLLAKLGGQEDIVVGTPVAGRNHADVRNIIGMFVNTLAIRSRPGFLNSFPRFVQEMKEVTLAAFANSEYPFEKLVERVDIAKDASRNPLFDTMFVLQNFGAIQDEIPDIRIPELTLKPYAYDAGKSQVDLTLTAAEVSLEDSAAVPDAIQFTFEYCTRLFLPETIERFAVYFKQLVGAVLENPAQRLADIDLIPEEEKQRLVNDFNDTAAGYPDDKTIHQLFEEQAAKTPGNIALTHNEHQLTYGQLKRKAHRLALYLTGKGIGPDSIVAIMTGPSLEMIIGILGILEAGGAYLPIDPGYPRERIDYMLKDSNAALLITTDDLKAESPATCNPQPATRKVGPAISGTGASGLAYIIYTSGTTGRPKGSMIEHRNVVRLMVNDRNLFDFNNRDTWTLFHSFCFDFSVWEMYGALLFGGKLVVIPREVARDARRYLHILEEQTVTVLNQTPSAFYNLAAFEMENPDPVLALRYVIFGGEALKPAKLKRWREKYPETRLINMYGITETTVHVTFKEITPGEIEKGSSNIGGPIPTLSVYVVDRWGKLAPMGVAGELWVAGDGVARGYLNRPQLTADRFSPAQPGYRSYNSKKIYKSGDLARWLATGDLEYLGRIDHQVKIRGYRVELGEIETHLLQHPAVEETVVLAKGSDTGEYLCAYIVTGNETIDNEELRGYLSRYLPEYMIPGRFISMDSFPITPNGKIDRRALPEPELTVEGDYTAPASETQKKLAEIWQNLLKTGRAVGVHEDFFQIGGHSLNATIMASMIHREFQVKLPLVEIFKTRTIRGLAAYIDGTVRETYSAIAAAEDRDYYPLSSAQKRLYILQQMDRDSTAYNITQRMKLEGNLDAGRLHNIFTILVQRHESLRTSFILMDGEPVQLIHKEKKCQLEIAEIVEPFVCPFDLACAPLIRVGLQKTGESEYLLVVDMHHIISDGVSAALLVSEFMACYSGAALPDLRLHYRDFAVWENSPDVRAKIRRQEQWWLRHFDKGRDLPVLELPLDFPRPAVQLFEGAAIAFEIPAAETQQLRRLARENNVTLYMALLAVLNVFLFRLSGGEDVVVGTPAAGRRHPDLLPVMGMFVNTLAIRNYPAADRWFDEFLKDVGERALEAFDNQDYPFEDLVEKISRHRDPSRNPFFDVMLVLQNTNENVSAADIPGLRVQPDAYENRTAKFDLTFQAYEVGDGMLFSLEYCTQLFKNETVLRFIRYFKNITAAVLENPGQRLAAIDFIPEEEKQQLLKDFNNTAVEYPGDKTLPQLFEEQAAKTPGNIAVTGGEQQLTYSGLNGKANRLAASLQDKGIGSGSIVAIKIERSLEMVVGILGILISGAAYLPIDPGYPQDRIDYMLKDSNAALCLDEKSYRSHMSYRSYSPEVWSFRAALPGTGASGLVYVIYTSGTTGKPKGVMVTHRNVVRLVMNTKYVKLDRNTRVLQTGAPVFDATTFEIWGPLLNGGHVVPVSNDEILDANRMGRSLIRYGINTLWLTSSLFNQLMQQSSGIFSCLDYLLVGGDVLSPTAINRVRTLHKGLTVINGYGPTENTTFSTAYTIEEDFEAGIPIGRPIANSTAYILSANSELQPIGVSGELYVGGDGVARGYLNNPELTADKFVFLNRSYRTNRTYNRFYKTGDLARWLPCGNIEFLGRIDRQVKLRGFRIELGEIENQLLKHSAIKEVTVLAKGTDAGKYLCAYVVADSVPVDEEEFRGYLSRSLPSYMIPTHFVMLDRFPLSVNGKLDHNALPDPDVSNSMEYRAPGNEIETQLVELWQEVLCTGGKIGVRDDFFALGGNSLKMLGLAAGIHRRFELALPVSQLFGEPTVEAMARAVSTYNSLTREKWVIFNKDAEQNLFCFPPAAGYGIAYTGLSGQMKDYTLYAFNYIHRGGEIEPVIKEYKDSIMDYQPEGDLVLLGYSAGGKVAVKTAAALEEAGRTVSRIILVDCYRVIQTYEEWEKAEMDRLFNESFRENISGMGLQYMENEVMEQLHRYMAFHSSLMELEPVSADLHLIKGPQRVGAKAITPEMHWDSLARGRYIIYDGYGAHHEMFSPGYLEQNSRLMLKILEDRSG